MGKQKLTELMVKHIKQLLLEGDLTHKEIAKKINHSLRCNHKDKLTEPKTISRETITKIGLGMKNENDKNARWTDVKLK